MHSVLVPLADGVEEMEAVIVIDTLRRAGWNVVVAGLNSPVEASRGVKLLPDLLWEEVEPAGFEALVLPGGADGVANLIAEPTILEAIRNLSAHGRIVAAICAAPLVLQAAGVLEGRTVTCHPGVRAELESTSVVDESVVVDGRIVTSRGPGTAFEFALALIAMLDDEDAARAVAEPMLVQAAP